MTWEEKIPEILISSVLVAGGGWLINETYGINRAVGSLDAKLSENTGRIDRIAAVLPDVGIRVAKEELAKPVTMAVVVLNPKKDIKGKWVTGVHVIDMAAMTRNTYVVPVNGSQDKEVAWLVSGAANEVDSKALSFKTLAAFSSDIGTPTSLPLYVHPQYSFVLRGQSSKYLKTLAESFRGRAATQQTGSIAASVNSWEKLTLELKNNPQKYEVDGKE